MDEFTSEYTASTALFEFRYIMAKLYANAISGSFKRLNNYSSGDQPVFLFAHIICPHYPYRFMPDGKLQPIRKHSVFDTLSHVMQIKYVNRMLLEAIDRINDCNNIIVLQSDHGFNVAPKGETLIDSRRNIEIATNVLNAWYLPGDESKTKLPNTTINTLRFLADKYLNTNYGLLSDNIVFYDENKGDSSQVIDSLLFYFK